MFRLVATFQECCLKALNSRERFFKVTNVLVIERSVDWRLPFSLFSAFTEISTCLLLKQFLQLRFCSSSMKAIYAHYVCDDSFMTLELVSLTVEITDYKMDIVKVA